MKDIYEIEVNEKLFSKIKQKKCSHYIFVNDRVRLQYKIGNYLTFVFGEERLKVSIVNMLYFTNIKELLDMVGKEKFGYTPSVSQDKIEDSYYANYKASDIEKFGLVSVEFKLED